MTKPDTTRDHVLWGNDRVPAAALARMPSFPGFCRTRVVPARWDDARSVHHHAHLHRLSRRAGLEREIGPQVRLESGLMDRVAARAHTEGIPVSGVVRKSLKTYMEDVGPEAVMIRLTPYYREQLVKRLQEYPGQEPGAVLERFLQLALDGSWLLTDREG